MHTAYLVRRARFLLGMTQDQFAEMFGVDTGAVSRWERGKLSPSPEVADKVREINREGSVLGVQAILASPIALPWIEPTQYDEHLKQFPNYSELRG